jgi:hypothetical protein
MSSSRRLALPWDRRYLSTPASAQSVPLSKNLVTKEYPSHRARHQMHGGAKFSGSRPAGRARTTRLALLLMTCLSTPALAQYVPQSSVGAASGVAPLDASSRVPRPNLPVDMLNLATLGAKLDGTASDQQTIQGIYNGLPAGSVVQIPQNSVWDGTITPDPSKFETWIFNGAQAGFYPPPVGDGDLTVSYNSGSLSATKKLVNTTRFTSPGYFFLWNQDPNFLGPYSGKLAAIYIRLQQSDQRPDIDGKHRSTLRQDGLLRAKSILSLRCHGHARNKSLRPEFNLGVRQPAL